jgi:CBS domain-containing protein
MRTVADTMRANQVMDEPLHTWDLAKIPAGSPWIDNYKTVEQFMTTDLLTVRPDDPLELAAHLMRWKRVRHVPVEFDDGRLAGIVSDRDLIKLVADGDVDSKCRSAVRYVMTSDPITISPETPALQALEMMRNNAIGCLPVVKQDRLVGLITAYDFLTVSAKLFEQQLAEVCAHSDKLAKPHNRAIAASS